jgi:16S rRNA processing protein RimM
MSDSAAAFSPVLDDGVVWPADAVEVGRIVDAWGVKGGIKVQPFSSDPQALFCTKKWFLRPAEPASGALTRPSAAKTAAKAVTPVAAKAAAAKLAKPRFLQMQQVREQGDIVVATAEGLEDRNDAEALKGARVYVSRSAFPTPSEDEFYWVDLIGLDVVNREGVAMGRVKDLMATGPQTVLVLEYDEGGKPAERMIPFVSAYVDTVDLEAKKITVDWQADY